MRPGTVVEGLQEHHTSPQVRTIFTEAPALADQRSQGRTQREVQTLEPLSTWQGGPVRLFITDVESCDVANVNACTNVKDLDRIRITVAPEADTL